MYFLRHAGLDDLEWITCDTTTQYGTPQMLDRATSSTSRHTRSFCAVTQTNGATGRSGEVPEVDRRSLGSAAMGACNKHARFGQPTASFSARPRPGRGVARQCTTARSHRSQESDGSRVLTVSGAYIGWCQDRHRWGSTLIPANQRVGCVEAGAAYTDREVQMGFVGALAVFVHVVGRHHAALAVGDHFTEF